MPDVPLHERVAPGGVRLVHDGADTTSFADDGGDPITWAERQEIADLFREVVGGEEERAHFRRTRLRRGLS